MIEIALMALINRARGGLVPSWWDKVTNYLPRNLDYFIAIMAVMLLVQDDTMVALLFAFGMYLGVMDGWGKWLGSILDRVNQSHEKEGFGGVIDFISSKLSSDYLNQSRLALALRGFQWFIFPLGFMAYMDIVSVHNAIALSFAMGVAWVGCIELSRYDFIKPINAWGLSEWLFGACQGIMLLLIFG